MTAALPRRHHEASRLQVAATSPSARLVAKRFLQAIPVLLGVSFITFSLLNLLPGDAATALLGLNATRSEIHALEVKLHLNDPFFVRYGHWLQSAVSGHFGASFQNGQPVSTVLAGRLPVTLELVIGAFLISVLLAVPVGVIAARKPRALADRLSIVVSMFSISTPSFVLGLVLIEIFAVHAGVLPATGYVPIGQNPGQNLKDFVLPCVSLALPLFASYSRLLRADIIDQMTNEDYIVAARAKGLRAWRILIVHALRNSIFGLVTLIGLQLGTLIGGTVVLEQIFALPGIGQELLTAINLKDIPMVEAIVLVFAVAVVVAGLLADLAFVALDPRIRYGRPTA
jgi:peptide/nickel transport system permease protein